MHLKNYYLQWLLSTQQEDQSQQRVGCLCFLHCMTSASLGYFRRRQASFRRLMATTSGSGPHIGCYKLQWHLLSADTDSHHRRWDEVFRVSAACTLAGSMALYSQQPAIQRPLPTASQHGVASGGLGWFDEGHIISTRKALDTSDLEASAMCRIVGRHCPWCGACRTLWGGRRA